MSFELETENIKIYEPIKAANVKAVVDTDIIVPDSKPDVLNILQVNALSSVREKHIQKDKLCVTGNIDYTILYSGGDEEVEVKSINTSATFTEQIQADGIDETMFNYVLSSVSHVEFKIQNSRKINIKAVVDFDTGIAGKTIAPTVSSVLTDVKLPMKKEKVNVLNLAVCTENNFYIQDEIKFPGIPGEIDEILKTDIKLTSREVKTMNNKIVLKGSLVTDTLYSVEGDMYHMENETPFTEVIDADGLTPEMHTEVKYAVHNADFKLVTGESECYVDFNGSVDVLIKAYEENSYEIVSDVYSPDYEIETTRRTCTLCNVEDTLSQTFSLTETISVSEGMPGIVKIYNLTVNPVVESINVSDGFATADGYMDTKILYLSDSKNMPVYSITRKLPFSLRINNRNLNDKTEPDADISLEHASYILKSERDVEIRAALKLNAKIITQNVMDLISDITINEEAPLKKQEQPGIVIYFADAGETLWDIAKRYNTTTDEIASVNGIESDMILKNRQQLIIPKRLVI